MENISPPKYSETQNNNATNNLSPEQMKQVMEMMQMQNQQPTQQLQQLPLPSHQVDSTTNINVSVGRRINHCFYCIFTTCTFGIGSLCWCGACLGCCPTCE